MNNYKKTEIGLFNQNTQMRERDLFQHQICIDGNLKTGGIRLLENQVEMKVMMEREALAVIKGKLF